MDSQNRLVIGGNFTVAGGRASTYLARLTYNHAPQIASFGKTTESGTPVYFQREDFTGNFSDQDGDLLEKVTVVSLPGNGALTLGGAYVEANQQIPVNDLGSLVYSPKAGWSGSDSFDWIASDGLRSAESIALVSLRVEKKVETQRVWIYLPEIPNK
jgi:hypothetical protein